MPAADHPAQRHEARQQERLRHEHSVHLIEMLTQYELDCASNIKVQLLTAAATQEILEVRPGEGGEQGGSSQEEHGERGVHHGCKPHPVAPQFASSQRREHCRGRVILHMQPTEESREEPVDAPGTRVRARASSPQPARQCEDRHPAGKVRVELRRAEHDRAARQHAERGEHRVDGGRGPCSTSDRLPRRGSA